MMPKMNYLHWKHSKQGSLASRPGLPALDWHALPRKRMLVEVVGWQAAGGYELAPEQQGLGLPPFHSLPEC